MGGKFITLIVLVLIVVINTANGQLNSNRMPMDTREFVNVGESDQSGSHPMKMYASETEFEVNAESDIYDCRVESEQSQETGREYRDAPKLGKLGASDADSSASRQV